MTDVMAFESFADGDMVVLRNQLDICGSCDVLALLEFLCFSGRNVIRVAFEIDEFAAPVLRKLPESGLRELLERKETCLGRFRVYYIPGVQLQVGPAGARFGTAYFGVKNFLNIPGILPTPPLDDVQSIGQEITGAINTIGLGGNHLRLSSPAAVFIASAKGSEFMRSVPLDKDLPASVLDDAVYLSSLADDKYWVEAHQIGRWSEGELWDYDLTMAFGSVCARLLDLRGLSFWTSPSLGRRELGAYYGVIEGKFWIDPEGCYAHASPVVAELPNGLMGCAVGNLPEDVYTLNEIRTVDSLGIGRFVQTGKGVFASPIGGVKRPYWEIMEWLYGRRVVSDMVGRISKLAANALIGKMIEKREGAPYRNRFYHAQITATTRCLVSHFLVNNDVRADELIAIQTDGVKLTRDISVRCSDAMGSWRSNGTHDCIIHSGRKVYEGDRRPYKVTYADVESLVSEHPNKELYGKKAPHYLTLAEAVELGDAHRVGELVDLPTHFDLRSLDTQLTRVFDKLPHTGRELLSGKYSSRPVVFE